MVVVVVADAKSWALNFTVVAVLRKVEVEFAVESGCVGG
jgi:hypothetical protein